MIRLIATLLISAIALACHPAFAQETPPGVPPLDPDLKKRVEEIEQEIKKRQTEADKNKTGTPMPADPKDDNKKPETTTPKPEPKDTPTEQEKLDVPDSKVEDPKAEDPGDITATQDYKDETELYENEVQQWKAEQRATWAARVIQDYPGTELAESAQKVLYDAAEERYRTEVTQWILPQQRQWAIKTAEKFPNTKLAEELQLILREFEAFDVARNRQLELEKRRNELVRNYWEPHRQQWAKARERQLATVRAHGIVLQNESTLTILYEMKTRYQKWSGPFQLSPGQRHVFANPVDVRFIDRLHAKSLVVKHLSAGTRYAISKDNRTDPIKIEPVGR